MDEQNRIIDPEYVVSGIKIPSDETSNTNRYPKRNVERVNYEEPPVPKNDHMICKNIEGLCLQSIRSYVHTYFSQVF